MREITSRDNRIVKLCEQLAARKYRDRLGLYLIEGENLLEEAVPDPDFPEGEMYILGEYCNDLLGKYINLYYGSFAALAKSEDWDADTWVDELRITLAHELTHHLEALGGLHDLDDQDAEELARWRVEFAAEADAMEEE